MKWSLPLLVSGCLLFTLLAFVGIRDEETPLEAEREIMVMRNIAHEVLRHTGDSSSRVLPITQLTKNEFLISFQSSFSFKPDSLVAVIDRQIALHELPGDYVVKVLDCKTEDVIYGYAIFKSKHNDIVPCLGRVQPEKKYCINIKFAQSQNAYTKPYLIGGILLLLGIMILGFFRIRKRKIATTPVEQAIDVHPAETSIAIGAYRFFPAEQTLSYYDEKIILTQKEAKLLGIFAVAPNQVIDRNRLQKEVWEDEGVIVGRSLDMFISRLRKKLEQDPSVKLANIHGKGYKLEIS
jgi:hypothetical protein